MLLASGADANGAVTEKRNEYETTALMFAGIKGHLQITQVILRFAKQSCCMKMDPSFSYVFTCNIVSANWSKNCNNLLLVSRPYWIMAQTSMQLTMLARQH